MLCCLLCLTVCVIPAFASNNTDYTDGLIYPQDGTAITVTDGTTTIKPLEGYFPATFSYTQGDPINDNYRNFQIVGRYFNMDHTANVSWDVQFSYIEVLFPVPAPLTVTVSGLSSEILSNVSGYLQLQAKSPTGDDLINGEVVNAALIQCVYDDNYESLEQSTGHTFTVPNGSRDVSRYFGYRYYFPSFSETKTIQARRWALALFSAFNGHLTFSDPNYSEAILDEVTVNTGVLQEINGTLTEIQTSTTQLQNDVSEIKNGLQDSNSSIWQSFKDSVSGLFVPSSAELEGVKNGFDQLAQDKLGGAYQTVELVDNGVQSVVNKFKNPGDSPGVEFPGISVPLGGDTGTVTLAASQTVTIPEKIANVLYPVSGVIIPIVCVIWTIRQCTDMVECFMSGMSYAEFLHRNSDKEDEEV